MSPARLVRRITPATRYPADPRALFILALCVLSGIPLIAANARPGSLNALMPQWTVVGWGVLLVLGSLVTLIGTFLSNVNGVITEQIGSVAVGCAATIYGSAAFIQGGWNAAFGGGIILAWGLACFWRWAQLQSLLWRTEAVVQELRDSEAQE